MFAEYYYTKHLSKKVNFQIGKRKKLKKQEKNVVYIYKKMPWLWRYGLVSLHPNHYCEQRMVMMGLHVQ